MERTEIRRGRRHPIGSRGLAWAMVALVGSAVAGCGGSASSGSKATMRVPAPPAQSTPAQSTPAQSASAQSTPARSASAGVAVPTRSNGLASASAHAIVSAAGRAMDGLTSVHVTGYGIQSGAPMSFDLSIVSGKGGSGTLSRGSVQVRFVVVSHAVYLRGGKGFWKQEGLDRRFAGRWLKFTDSAVTSPFISLTTMPRLIGDLLEGGDRDRLVKAGAAMVGGQPTVAVHDLTHGGTMYVAASGRPYIVKIVNPGRAARAVFNGFNQGQAVTVPSQAPSAPTAMVPS